MNIKVTCEQCGNQTERPIKVGDIIRLGDGSGMPNGLHHVLFNGVGSYPLFKPVRVRRIEGSMLAVAPLYWEYGHEKGRERLDPKVYPALSWIPGDEGRRGVFWVHSDSCKPIEEVK